MRLCVAFCIRHSMHMRHQACAAVFAVLSQAARFSRGSLMNVNVYCDFPYISFVQIFSMLRIERHRLKKYI